MSTTKFLRDGEGNLVVDAKTGRPLSVTYNDVTGVTSVDGLTGDVVLSGTYAKQTGTYPRMTVGSATKAAQDANGNDIAVTYVKKTLLQNYYFARLTELTAQLVGDKPTAAETAYLETTTTNLAIDFESEQKITITHTLQANLEISNQNAVDISMAFACSRNTQLEFAARVFVDDTQVSREQAFGLRTYNGSNDFTNVNELAASIVLDLIQGVQTFSAGQTIKIEIVTRQNTANTLNIRYFCGVSVSGIERNCFAKLDFSNAIISTNQITDGAITFPKLSAELQKTLAAANIKIALQDNNNVYVRKTLTVIPLIVGKRTAIETGSTDMPANWDDLSDGDLVFVRFAEYADATYEGGTVNWVEPPTKTGFAVMQRDDTAPGYDLVVAVCYDPESTSEESTPVIDLGEVTLTEQSLGGNIEISMSDTITVSFEQATQAQAETPPVVKVKIGGEYHEFYRTKISTDATAAYIYFTATEDLGEGTKFYYLQITVSESGGASAGLFVWNYGLLGGILNEFNIGTLTFTEDTVTRPVTDDEWGLVQGANVMTFRITDTADTVISEQFKMYLTHYHEGESNPDPVDLYNRSFFGVVMTQSGTPYGYSAVYDATNKQIVVSKVSLGSGGGLAQNEIINREASIDIANEESPDFVENSAELYAKQTIKASISILSEELDSGRINAPAVTADNGKIYIFGGISNSKYSDEIIEYDYNEKTIKTLSAKLPSGRDEVAAAFANNGNIYIFGGYTSGNGVYFSDICRFNIDTQKVTIVGTLDNGARNIAAVTANNGYIYLFGGERGTSGIGGGLGYTNKILKFSPETETYTTIGTTLPFENYCTAVNSTSGKIYIFPRYGNEIYEFDPELDTITKTISTIDAILPASWHLGRASNGLNENIYIFADYGGTGGNADRFLEFDPKTEILKTADTILPMVKRGSAIATGLDKIIYIIGGNDSAQILAFNSGKSSYKKYTDGKDGTTPHIGENKHWYIGEEDTGIIAEGKDGATPEIGANGNWFINGQDTGKPSKGAKGDDGKSVTSATAGTVSEADGYTITPIEFVFSDGSKTGSVEVKAKHGAKGTDAQVTKAKIAEVLGCTEAQIDALVALAQKITVSDSTVTISGNITATDEITGANFNTTA